MITTIKTASLQVQNKVINQMAALHMPCSIKLFHCHQVSKASLITTSRNLSLVASATKTITPTVNVTYQTTNLHQNIMFQEFSLMPRKLVADQASVKDHANKVKTKTEAEVADEEIGRIIQRLKTVVERVIELEIEKFMGKVKGVASYEDGKLVEAMSREIVSKFLEKPIQHLRSSDGNLEEKMRELSLVLEELNTC